MKPFFSLLISAVLLFAAATEPVVSRAMLSPIEKRIDQRLETLFDEPFLLLGLTRGLYLDKFGAVFSAELQLIATPGVGTFGFTAPTRDMIVSTRTKKLARLPLLKDAMKTQLASAALALDKLPADERVVFGVSIFRRSWEDSNGLPAQIVMQAVRKDLLAARTAPAIDAAIRVQEF
ncbi:hypothetical protein [Bryobacter aggregatus]|uniref:hypothetical protein n=1 Tax=Bryobacter aggregatus TaxID=360054 RepID=UPI0004E0D113|nr:hypothetical protein [Bryobacter aggregatus]